VKRTQLQLLIGLQSIASLDLDLREQFCGDDGNAIGYSDPDYADLDHRKLTTRSRSWPQKMYLWGLRIVAKFSQAHSCSVHNGGRKHGQAAAAHEALWLSKLLVSFGLNKVAMPIESRMDSESALPSVSNPVLSQRSKHVAQFILRTCC
jgi:hypothetical protein